ncbi:MAG TPA: L,D-transpeptidase [Candidatus Saccharimonadales bacterium]|jgi:hypothetical protein
MRRRHAILLAAAGVIVIVSAFALGHHVAGTHIGGMAMAVDSPKVAGKLQPPVMESAVHTQSADTDCAQNSSGKLLFVSISQQHLWACDGTSLVNQSAVTTGTTQVVNGVDDATPTGTWHIYSKQTNRTLRGCDANGCWNDPVQYWMPFDGEIGFHDASWQTFPFGGPAYHTDGSHGCVHLPTDFIAWVYGWASVGTTVTVES